MSVRKQEARDLTKLAVFMAFAVFVTVWLAAVTGDMQAGEKADYQARFADVSGLQVGDQVRVAGVSVGRVTAIDVQKDATVLVGFDVDHALRLSMATSAVVRYRNLIGDRLLELDRGAASAPPLAPGGTIALARTAPAVDLDALLNGFKPLFAGLDPAQINQLSGQLVDVLQGQQSAVDHLVSSVGSFTSTLGDRSVLITQVVTNLNSVLGEVADRKDGLGQLVTQLSDLVGGLEKQDSQVLDAAGQISTMARSGADLLARSRGDLTPTLDGLRASAHGLNQHANALQALLTQWPKHYAKIQDTASYGAFFNFFLCGIRLQFTRDGGASSGPYIRSQAARCQR
ncbi:MCE family protein [Nocardioides jejuensis]|uniref:MCE family protein n=1 Tax=Nocardioides jejuensis TaxID=2502782 RepID=A0A4R1CLC6_9ACTN|nr:MCE family protein [Nocardioides jejuensis]TCJ31026.1 MCE family protein [Nocardioides jejuensis]